MHSCEQSQQFKTVLCIYNALRIPWMIVSAPSHREMAITQAQLASIFERIKYPESRHASDLLQLLSELQKYFLAHIPFETLALHYSVDKHVSLEISDIYDKVVVRKRGGYCHELNTLMSAVLQAMGFSIFTVVCRFWNPRVEPPQYRPMYVHLPFSMT